MNTVLNAQLKRRSSVIHHRTDEMCNMVKVNYSNPQEPDEELRDAPTTTLFNEAGGSLDANASMLRFQGNLTSTAMAVLAISRPLVKVDRVLLYARAKFIADNNADDCAGLGIWFPDVMKIIGLVNVGSDNTDKIAFYDKSSNQGNLYASLDSVAEYSTTEGILKLQCEIIRGLNDKSLVETRVNIRSSWDGTLKHADIDITFNRDNPIMAPCIVVLTRGAASYVSIRSATLIVDNMDFGVGNLEAV